MDRIPKVGELYRHKYHGYTTLWRVYLVKQSKKSKYKISIIGSKAFTKCSYSLDDFYLHFKKVPGSGTKLWKILNLSK